jgi:hypothetical protein
MISKSQAAHIADDIVEAGRRDRAYSAGLTRPLPRWFMGPHLEGLSEHERRDRFHAMSQRAARRPGWAFAATLAITTAAIYCLHVARVQMVVFALWPAAGVLAWRHYDLRRELARDARAFVAASEKAAADDTDVAR